MILPDVNVLVNAFRADGDDHSVCQTWLTGILNGNSRYGIALQVLSGVLRVTTHPRVFARPSPCGEALDFCQLLIEQPHCILVQPGPDHWRIFTELCKTSAVRGNLVSDAWYAALAIESGCEWITLDRDYARFPGLKWRAPA